MVIRKCREGDFEQVLKLLEQLWPDQTIKSQELQQVFLQGLNSEFHFYVCATLEANLIGFVSLTIRSSLWQHGYIGHIDEIVVDKRYRGKGIGTKLLWHIVEVAKEKGCRRVELDSAFDRKQAHKFDEQNSFENRAFLFSKKLWVEQAPSSQTRLGISVPRL